MALGKELVSCYEAGPAGFWLHRQLTALGIRNYVVCPTCVDERHGGSGTTAQPARMKRAATAAINGSAEFSVTPAMRKATFPCPISDPAANMQ